MKSLLHSYPIKRGKMAVNDLLPHKDVVRDVQGVRLKLPRSHPLPIYAAGDSPYGANLVALAKALAAQMSSPLVVLDVGANIGDSTARILHAVGPDRARVVTVEPDPQWLPYLHENVANPSVSIDAALLVPDEARTTLAVTPVHDAPGTTRFEATPEGSGVVTLSVGQLRRRHQELEHVRLIKSDTDGFDVALVPELVRSLGASRPVVFFEYDPRLTRLATPDTSPESVWDELHLQGYTELAVWDNGGRPLGRSTSTTIHRHLGLLAPPPGARRRKARPYWDVAAAHQDDEDGQAVLRSLMPDQL